MQSAEIGLAQGTVVDGRFRIEALLGRGGMGAVFGATDLATRVPVAIKVMRRELLDDAKSVERFRREAALLANVAHPGIVSIYAAGALWDGRPYLVLELLRGETLAARLERAGAISAAEVLPIVHVLCDALEAAHGCGVIHRDIKPSNVFLLDPAYRAPTQAAIKLVDFGVAKARAYETMTSTGLAVGTVRYMAPEQLSGASDLDGRVDVYALGVSIYEALAGASPFARAPDDHLLTAILVGRSTPLRTIRPDVSPRVAAVVARAMARSRAERYQSPAALAHAFRAAVLERDDDESEQGIPPTREIHVLDSGAALADTHGATPPGPLRPAERRRRPLRAPFLLVVLLPILGTCLVFTTLGWACKRAVGNTHVDWEMNEVSPRLHAAVRRHPSRAVYEADLARLEAIHARGETNWFALSELRSRVDRATSDGVLDEHELDHLMGMVRDIVAHGGKYDFATYWDIVDQDESYLPDGR